MEDPIVLKAKQLQPVIKVKKLARIAKENDWHGTLDSNVDDVLSDEGIVNRIRYTTLEATRNDEVMIVCYIDNALTHAEYQIFDRVIPLQCASEVIEKLQGWPNLLKLFKWFPDMNKPTLVDTYRRLPFTFDESHGAIIAKLMERKLFWYSHEFMKIGCDIPLPPKTKTAQSKTRIVDVGHRKLFHFMGAKAGFRSILLDTLIKVG